MSLNITTENFVKDVNKLNKLKQNILQLNIPDNSNVFRRNGLIPAVIENGVLCFDSNKKYTFTELAIQLHSDISKLNDVPTIESLCKLLSNDTHRYGIITVYNISPTGISITCNIMHILNAKVNYYDGLNTKFVNDVQTIYKSEFNKDDTKISIEKYDELFQPDKKCFYYIIETLDGKHYTFLTLKSYGKLEIDSSLKLTEWNPYIGECNKIFQTEILNKLDVNLILGNKQKHNKYDINYADMAEYLTDKITEKYDRLKIESNLMAVLNDLLQLIVNYVSIHVSNLVKEEIYCAIVSEKHKLFKHLLYDMSTIKSSTNLEFKVKLYEVLRNVLTQSKMFKLLYIKELLIY